MATPDRFYKLRFQKSELPPFVLTKINEVVYGGTGTYNAAASMRHYSAWWKAYRTGFLTWTAVSLAPIVTLAIARSMNAVPEQLRGPAAAVALLTPLAVMLVGWWTNSKQITAAELESLLPAMNVDELEALYCECLVRGARNPLISDQELTELKEKLDDLFGQWSHLQQVGQHVPDGAATEAIKAEARRLQEQMDSTQDDMARETLGEALRLVEDRLRRGGNLAARYERVLAQKEVIRQTLLGLKESLGRLELGTPPVRLQLDHLGATTRATRDQLASLEDAYEEAHLTLSN